MHLEGRKNGESEDGFNKDWLQAAAGARTLKKWKTAGCSVSTHVHMEYGVRERGNRCCLVVANYLIHIAGLDE